MAIFVPKAKAEMTRCGLAARFSYDNNKIQATADLAKMHMQPQDKVALGPYMPDCHKAIEHAVGNTKRSVQAKLYEEGWLDRKGEFTPQEAQELVQEAFHNLSTDAIRKDVESLPYTYKVISAPRRALVQGPNGRWYEGTAGDWPPAELR